MPTKDFARGIKNLKGEDSHADGKLVAMKDMIVVVLLEEGDRGQYRIQSGVDRAKAAKLAEKVFNAIAGGGEYTIDELKLIKDRIELMAPPLVTLRIVEHLDAE